MNPTSISTILNELSANTPLGCIEGTITSLYERKNGTTGNGREWSTQNGAFRDASGQTIKIRWKDCPEVDKGWKGRQVRISSVVNDRNNRTGLYVEDDEYNGKTTRQIKVTPTATIVDMATSRPVTGLSEAVNNQLDQRQRSAQQAPPAQQAPQHQAPPADHHQQAPTQRTGGPPSADDSPDVYQAKVMKRLRKMMGLQSKCYDAAAASAHAIYERHGIAVMPGAVGIMADKLFMEMIRRIDVDCLPVDPYKSAPFQGTPLDALLPAMRQQIGEGRAEMEFASTEKRMEIGRQNPLPPSHPPANNPPPQQPAPQQQPAPWEPQPGGPDDDCAPF